MSKPIPARSLSGVSARLRYATRINRTADDHSPQALAAAALATAGAAVRMYAEETPLIGKYPEYAGYRARTARVIPFVL